jgi:UDP-N-acetylmuramate dehydrogenase
MLDILGYKGAQIGNLGFYENNALVLVHHGGATRAELDALIAEVTAKVYEAFGVAIEPEAELL